MTDQMDYDLEKLSRTVEARLLFRDAWMHQSSLDQRIFYLKYFEGFSLKEISREIGLSVNAVRNRNHRTLMDLRKRLSE